MFNVKAMILLNLMTSCIYILISSVWS